MAEEESEITMELGRVVRAALGSGMQAVEQVQRRSQMAASNQHAAQAREGELAERLRKDFATEAYWQRATTEDVADRMAAATELGKRHPAASAAYMTGADQIRNRYGINIEEINRDHPTALVDRHRALRDALDDHLAARKLDSEAQSEQGQEAQGIDELEEGHEQRPRAEELEGRSEQARSDESAHLRQAESAEGEIALDRGHAGAQEARHRQEPPEVSGAATPAGFVWKGKGGQANPNFPHPPTTKPAQTAMNNRQRVVAAGQTKTLEKGLTR